MGGGLNRICKHFGGAIVVDHSGKEIEYTYDYHRQKAVPIKEMRPEQSRLSELARRKLIKNNNGTSDKT